MIPKLTQKIIAIKELTFNREKQLPLNAKIEFAFCKTTYDKLFINKEKFIKFPIISLAKSSTSHINLKYFISLLNKFVIVIINNIVKLPSVLC